MNRRGIQAAGFSCLLILISFGVIAYRWLSAENPASDLASLSPFIGLSPSVQDTIKGLLVLPIGLLVLVFIRLFVGIPTIGTFMPVLIGLAFLEMGMGAGIILFLSVILIGLGFRYSLGPIRLLLVPRLAAIFILLVVLLIFISYGIDRFGLPVQLGLSVLPLVIITMSIERLFVAIEEVGAKEAGFQLAGSLVCAILSCFAMSWSMLTTTLYVFPELLLALLGINLLAGRYMGFRLSEYLRFRSVGR